MTLTKQLAALTLAALAVLSPARAQTAMSAPADEKPGAEKAAASGPSDEKPGVEEKLSIAEAIAPSLVRVEFTLQYDKGETPSEALISEERPWEADGFVLTPTKVVTDDFLLHPRFIKDISVRCGNQVVKAKVSAWGKGHACTFLELAEPLKNAKPLVFDPAVKGPYLAVTYTQQNAEWTIHVSPLDFGTGLTDKGRKFLTTPAAVNLVVTDKKGTVVGLLTDHYIAADNTWKGSPLAWPVITAAEMEKTLKDIEAKADQSLLRVALAFRSPKKTAARAIRSPEDEDETEGTERNVIGVLAASQKILVLSLLSPKTTARLEKITVYPPKGEPVPAKFDCTLTNYGAFLAVLEKPLEGAVSLSPADILASRDALLYGAEVYLQGERRVTYFNHSRIGAYQFGWHRQIYPQSQREHFFQFDARGNLVVLPVARREKGAVQRYRAGAPLETAAVYVKDVLDAVAKKTDLATHVDAQNVPLTEEQENRLAWMGVELQPLDRELARSSGVADLTNDGATGAMVSYVYEDSPAAKAGIKMGDILLRLHVEGQPKPMDVIAEADRFGGPFPWEQLDRVREESYDRVPTPWAPAESRFTRALTDFGFGKKYTADFFRDGKVLPKDFTIVEGPQYYESAPKFKSDATGITVRDITYEARRYFQKKPGDPGVIISMLTPGSKGSVAGLKPFEIITHVNDKPVASIKDFEALVKGQSELRLSVVRMTRGRTVKIELGPEATTREGGSPPRMTTTSRTAPEDK
jgi:serine protease Do